MANQIVMQQIKNNYCRITCTARRGIRTRKKQWQKGLRFKNKTVNDYKVPNKLLDKGDVDANFFQHVPYLKAERKDHNYNIEEVGKVFTTPMGVYSQKYKNIKDIPKGSTIYVSNNPAEEGRFLSFFVDKGLIKIKKVSKSRMLSLMI